MAVKNTGLYNQVAHKKEVRQRKVEVDFLERKKKKKRKEQNEQDYKYAHSNVGTVYERAVKPNCVIVSSMI